MSAPDTALQRAMYAALIAAPDMVALVGGRVFDRVPADAGFPRITFGEMQTIDDDGDCVPACEVIATLDVWSRAVGSLEAKDLCWAVRRALDDAPLDLGDHALVSLDCDGSRIFTDPDGLTTHGVVTFRALIESPRPPTD